MEIEKKITFEGENKREARCSFSHYPLDLNEKHKFEVKSANCFNFGIHLHKPKFIKLR